jgi:transcriptional regulator with XRE-family HTH domain
VDRLPTITDRLVSVFRESGLSQSELARRVGVTRASVNGWLQGRAVNIRPHHLFPLADQLGVEARWLATGRGPRDKQPMSNGELKLISEYRSLPDDQRNAVELIVHRIADTQGDYS